MCYFDDNFMAKCFDNYPEGVELILRIILGNTELTVKNLHTQAVIKNLQGCSIRMDVKVSDIAENSYNVEAQRNTAEVKPKRARYNS